MPSVRTYALSGANSMGSNTDNKRAFQDNLYAIQEYNLQSSLPYLNIISYNSMMHSKMHSEMDSEMHSEMLSKLPYKSEESERDRDAQRDAQRNV